MPRSRPTSTRDPEIDTQVVCVDKKRQWRHWRNIWHSAAIRSSIYMMGAPFRAIAKPFKRKSADGGTDSPT